jgi:hypothetical protein
MIVYTGPAETTELIAFFRREAASLRTLRKLIVSREKTTVLDVNRDGIEFPGLTYGSETLEELLRELGVVFVADTLHDPAAAPGGVKEFSLGACWPWGYERIL